MKILFSSFACEDLSVAMVTNMISRLQGSFLLRCAAAEHYMDAWGHEFYLLVLKVSLTSERSLLVRDTFSTSKPKIKANL